MVEPPWGKLDIFFSLLLLPFLAFFFLSFFLCPNNFQIISSQTTAPLLSVPFPSIWENNQSRREEEEEEEEEEVEEKKWRRRRRRRRNSTNGQLKNFQSIPPNLHGISTKRGFVFDSERSSH